MEAGTVRNEGREQRSLEGRTRLEQGLAVQTQMRQLKSKMVGLVRRAERVVGVSEGAWRASEVTMLKVGEQCYSTCTTWRMAATGWPLC